MFLWDVLFPRRCLGCGRYGAYVCMDCSISLKPLSNQLCLYCGRPSMWGLTHPACRHTRGVDGRMSLYYYNITLKKIIAGLKYRLVTDSLPDLRFVIGRQAGFLTGIVRGLEYPPLQPVTLSPARKNERGFNQAEYISRIFTALLPLRQVDLLERVKNTPPQATLPDRRLRRGNIKGAFLVKKSPPLPERVILVDDVITTGETVKEAARILKAAGVKKVYALSVAKG